jgi:hypothetical protein
LINKNPAKFIAPGNFVSFEFIPEVLLRQDAFWVYYRQEILIILPLQNVRKQMKTVRIFLLLLACPLVGFTQADFSWLEGSWKLQGKNVYEIWEKKEGVLKGKSFKVSATDTTLLEKITLRERNGVFYYVPDVKENNGEVEFKMTSITADGFVAENPAHDFPKLIRYTIVRKENTQTINASIEGNGKVIRYTFDKVP